MSRDKLKSADCQRKSPQVPPKNDEKKKGKEIDKTPIMLETPQVRISLEYARTIMGIGILAFIVLLIRADVAVMLKIFFYTLLFMGSVVATLLGIKR